MIVPQATAVCNDCHGTTVIQETAILSPAKHFQSGPPRAEVGGFDLLSGMGQHYNYMRQGNDADLHHSQFTLFVDGRPVGTVSTNWESILEPAPMWVQDRGIEHQLTTEFLSTKGLEIR